METTRCMDRECFMDNRGRAPCTLYCSEGAIYSSRKIVHEGY